MATPSANGRVRPREGDPHDEHEQPLPDLSNLLDRHVGRDHHDTAQPRPRRRADGPGGLRRARLLAARPRRPTPQQVRVFEAVLVALADHGFTPTAIAARVTYLSAPDALHGALAAGLLGGGSRFLGVTEDTGRFLAGARVGGGPAERSGRLGRTGSRRAHRRARGRYVPGLGHPVHKEIDPRTPRLIEIAREEGRTARTSRCSRRSGGCTRRSSERLPLNGAGVCGAALADLDLPIDLLRGVALIARAPACSVSSPRKSAGRSPIRST